MQPQRVYIKVLIKLMNFPLVIAVLNDSLH